MTKDKRALVVFRDSDADNIWNTPLLRKFKNNKKEEETPNVAPRQVSPSKGREATSNSTQDYSADLSFL